LFESGDLPPFTTSGVDVVNGGWLPFGVRHYAATAPTRGEVLQLVEDFSKDPDGSVTSDGLTAYLRRVNDWLTGRLVQRPAPNDNADPHVESDLYDGMFGAQEAALAARNAPMLAAQADAMAQQRWTGKYSDGLGRAQR